MKGYSLLILPVLCMVASIHADSVSVQTSPRTRRATVKRAPSTRRSVRIKAKKRRTPEQMEEHRRETARRDSIYRDYLSKTDMCIRRNVRKISKEKFQYFEALLFVDRSEGRVKSADLECVSFLRHNTGVISYWAADMVKQFDGQEFAFVGYDSSRAGCWYPVEDSLVFVILQNPVLPETEVLSIWRDLGDTLELKCLSDRVHHLKFENLSFDSIIAGDDAYRLFMNRTGGDEGYHRSYVVAKMDPGGHETPERTIFMRGDTVYHYDCVGMDTDSYVIRRTATTRVECSDSHAQTLIRDYGMCFGPVGSPETLVFDIQSDSP